jgi:hypothetical protein
MPWFRRSGHVEAKKTAFPAIVYGLGTSIFHLKLAHSENWMALTCTQGHSVFEKAAEMM